MTIEFKKIPHSGIDFEVSHDGVMLKGNAIKSDKTMVTCKGRLLGNIEHACDRCAEVFTLLVDEDVEVLANDGLYEDQEGEELLNVIEFFDGSINFDTILQSELEALKSDYHYCGKCEQIQGV
ncbi:MAG: DNA-binding protein [Sulfurospirillaceae bacterium]|nr:DNA-binding protein [Sulfurospirillaceae bacterium]